MPDVNQMTAKPLEWPIGDKVYKFGLLDVDDLGEFNAWVLNKHIKAAHKVAAALKGFEKQEYLMSVLKELPHGTELDMMAAREMTSVEGIRKMIHLSLKKINSSITEEEVKKIVTIENLKELQNVVDKLSGFTEDETDKNKPVSEEEEEKKNEQLIGE